MCVCEKEEAGQEYLGQQHIKVQQPDRVKEGVRDREQAREAEREKQALNGGGKKNDTNRVRGEVKRERERDHL